MANKKEYEIIINGVTEATQNVETLGDALNRLNVNVETHSEGIKKSSSSMDELAKTELKITQYNEEYNRALQTNKAVLADKNKAIKEELDLENANIIVQENAQNTYREKQTLLTALGKVIKNTNAQTDEEKEKLNNLKSQYASLNQELKNFDAELGNHQRNVGDYGQATKNLKQELRGMQDEMANLLAQGIQKTDPAFQALAAKAGVLRDAMQDAREEVNRFASDTKKLDDVVNVAQSATAAFQLYSGAMNAFGIESREATKAIQELMGVMSIVQSLQTLSNALQNGSATARLFSMASKALKLDLIAADAAAIASTKSQQGLTTAQKAGTIATKTLSMAIKAIPLMFVIGLVTTLITHWEDLVGWFDKTFPSLKKVGGLMNGLKGVCMGLGKAIINWVVNPIKTMADVIQKVLKGDFEGAMKAVGDGIKNQFIGTAKAFKEGFQDTVEEGLEEISLKAKQEANKQTQYQLEMLKAQKGNQAKYSKEGIALQKKDFEERRKLAKGNQEELRKINIEEANFHRECEEEKTKATEAALKKRQDAAKKAADQQKKLEEERKKQEEEEEKRRQQHIKVLTEYDNSEYNIKLEQLKIDKKLLEERAKEYETKDIKKYAEILKEILKITNEITHTESGLEKNALLNSLISDNKTIDKYISDYAVKLTHKLANEILSKQDESPLFGWMIGQGANKEEAQQVASEMTKTLLEAKKILDNYTLFDGETVARAEKDVQNVAAALVKMGKNTFINELATLLQTDEFGFFEKMRKETKLTDDEITVFATNLKKYILESLKEADTVGENLNSTLSNIDAANEKVIRDQIANFEKLRDNADACIGDIIKDLRQIPKTKIYDPATFLFTPKSSSEARKRYRDLNKMLYENLKETLENQKKKEQEYLDNIKKLYGENSREYINACNEMEQRHKRMLQSMEKAAKAANIDPQTGEDKPKKTGIEGVGQQIKDALDPQIDWNEFWWNPDAPVWDNIGEIYDKLDEAVFSPINDAFSMMLEFQIEEAQEALDKATEMHDKSVEAVESSKSRLDEINNQMSSANSAQLAELKAKQADEMLLLAQREAEEKRLAKEKQKRQEELDKKEKQKKKLELRAQLVEAIANVAMGVTKTLGSYPWPVNAVFAALTAAMGAIQISTIQKQLSKLEDGGLLKGRSHANGGMRIQGTNIEVEGGEYVVNKKSTKKYLPLLQAINEEGRTASYKKPIASHQMMKYASGGEINYQRIDNNLGTLDTNKVIQSSIGEIEMHPVVSVVDINKGQKNLTQVRQMAGSTRK